VSIVAFINHEFQVSNCINSPTCCEVPCSGRPTIPATCCPLGETCSPEFLCVAGPACGTGFCPVGNTCISEPGFVDPISHVACSDACCPTGSQLCGNGATCCMVPPRDLPAGTECSTPSGPESHCCPGPADAGVGLINGNNGAPCPGVAAGTATREGVDPGAQALCCPPNLACNQQGACCDPHGICPASAGNVCCQAGTFCSELNGSEGGSPSAADLFCCPFGTFPCDDTLPGGVPCQYCAPGNAGEAICPARHSCGPLGGQSCCGGTPPAHPTTPSPTPWGP
jgi:hypothetical protein